MKKCNRDYLEEIISQILIWFFIAGAVALILLIPVSIFVGGTVANLLIGLWIVIWGLSFAIFLAWPYIRWMTTKVYDVIKDS